MYCTKRTIIAERLPSDIPNKLRVEVKGKRRNILRKVKSYTDIELNPSKRKLYDPARDNFEEASSIEDILISFQIATSDYEAVLSVSDDNNSKYILKGLSSFANNYFLESILVWRANLDINLFLTIIKRLPICVHISCNQKVNVHKQ